MSLSDDLQRAIKNGTEPPKPSEWAENYGVHKLHIDRNRFRVTAAWEGRGTQPKGTSATGYSVSFSMATQDVRLKNAIPNLTDAKRAGLMLAVRTLRAALEEAEAELTAFNLEYGTGE